MFPVRFSDFLAHEVRNPLAAAISACSFVSAAVDTGSDLSNSESRKEVREDVNVIQSSLTYINDLLRSMIDMHKASSDQLRVELLPANLRRDIFDPVATMLYQREDTFTVEIECPENLTITTDRIKLKQIVLNLANNACKFVHMGFVRIGARVEGDGDQDETVIVFIEDSGPGIPKEKQDGVFDKFQSSLDTLSQGTGIGLSLCKDLAGLLGGTLALDKEYDSGVPECPGARFVINLNTKPLEDGTEDGDDTNNETGSIISFQGDLGMDLPSKLKVLFVDDDVSVGLSSMNLRHRHFFEHCESMGPFSYPSIIILYRSFFESFSNALSNVFLRNGMSRKHRTARQPFDF